MILTFLLALGFSIDPLTSTSSIVEGLRPRFLGGVIGGVMGKFVFDASSSFSLLIINFLGSVDKRRWLGIEGAVEMREAG